MAEEEATITLRLPPPEADAFACLLKRMGYTECARLSNRFRQYPDGRSETDVMWAGLQLVEHAFAEAGFAPR